MSHNHHGGCGCGHGNATGNPSGDDLGVVYSLYQKIDLDRVECLNEVRDGSGKLVFKSYQDRLDTSKFVESDTDEELLFNIPFTGVVKLKGFIISGWDDATHPAKVRLFKNRPNMTFDETQAEADQEFDLIKDPSAENQYEVKIVKFSAITHLTIHIPTNFGAEQTKVCYIGLRGEFTEAQREPILVASYELRPNPADHKLEHLNDLHREVQ